jgi:general stress protein 26
MNPASMAETARPSHAATHDRDATVRAAARRALERNHFCTLATCSLENLPHVVGVTYAAVDGRLYIHTIDTSRKAVNIRRNPRVAVCVPVRRLPFGPPFCVQFQGKAELLAADDPEIEQLIGAGKLKSIVAFGALSVPGTCFLRVTLGRRISTFGIGVPMLELLRDLHHANRSVDVHPS